MAHPNVVYGVEGLTQTWQDPFQSIIECSHCEAEARIIFTVLETGENNAAKRYITDWRRDTDKMWPHDCCAFAVYMCPNCLFATTLWNQA